MGVAILKTEYRATKENGFLDFEVTLQNLQKIMTLINEKEIIAYNNV